MTAVWGPMGWITLHSISVCYPDNPSDEDKRILQEYINAFRDCITCIYCRQHFTGMFADYIRKVPSWLNSKKDLFIAICRMHNAVNRRLDKPQPKTIDECIVSLKRATSYSSAQEFRQRYSEYLLRDWGSQRNTGDGLSGYKNALTVKKINEEYWNRREVSYNDILFEGDDDVINYSDGYKAEGAVIPKFNLNALLGKRW